MEVKDRRRERSAVVSVHQRSSKVGVAKASGCHGREVSGLGQRQFRGVGVLEAPSYRELMREGERGWVESGASTGTAGRGVRPKEAFLFLGYPGSAF